MARASNTALNQALDALSGGTTNVLAFVALHVGDPGTNGASENANAGSYARQACTWNAAASAAKTNSSALTFSTLGTVAVTYLAGWSSGTSGGGTYGIGAALTSAVTAATITVAAGAITFSAS